MSAACAVSGVGLGLRSEFIVELLALAQPPCDFLEVTPENWLEVGGWRARALKNCAEQYPMIAHGLSLSVGGPQPLNFEFIRALKKFIQQYDIRCYSEHLSYCSDNSGYLYDLMPLPFTAEAVSHVVERIKQVQDMLGQRIALENVSYYCAPSQVLSESEFINAVLAEADCNLLLDVNNIYVNSVNHGYNAHQFLASLPHERITYVHIAGHHHESDNLLIDTHGDAVIPEVWNLLDSLYQTINPPPTLLERDNHIPPLKGLLPELGRISALQKTQITRALNE